MDILRRSTVMGVALLILASGGVVAPAMASEKPAKQAEAQVKRGYEAARRGYWQEALFRFERANGLTPNDPRILNNIAVALEASGRFEDAMAAYESALAVAPNDRVLRQNFSRFKEFYEAQVAPPKPPDEQASKPGDGSAQTKEQEGDDA